jgi:undecaprenyl-diphosphatase
MSTWIVRLGAADERLLRALVLRRRPTLDRFMQAITHLADWPVAVLVTLALAAGIVPELQAAGVRAVWTLASAHLAVEVLKRLFTRERPQLGRGMQWLVTVPDRFSFPSGHATAAMSMALPVALALGWPWGSLVAGVGVLVGVSRCYLGVHYPGDVAAGWTLAALTLAAVVGIGF